MTNTSPPRFMQVCNNNAMHPTFLQLLLNKCINTHPIAKNKEIRKHTKNVNIKTTHNLRIKDTCRYKSKIVNLTKNNKQMR